MSEENNPKVIYLGPFCQEQGLLDGREWCQDDVWDACECGHESVRYNLGADFDRVTAERDALQQRLTAADERNDEAIDLLRRARAVIEDGGWADLERDIAKFLKP